MFFAINVALQRLFMKLLKLSVPLLGMRQPELLDGPGSSLQLVDRIADQGITRLLVVTDAVLRELGLLKEIEQALQTRGVDYVIFDGVTPDPSIAQIEMGLAMLKTHRSEAVLAVGGGSPIDAGKMIAVRATNHKPIEKMSGLMKVRKAMLPMFAVPTTAGTGSETTFAAVVSDPEKGAKFPVADPKLVPNIAALDGNLAVGLPAAVTAATGMDALTHCVEAYLSDIADDESDAWVLKATKAIFEHLPAACEDGAGDVARRQALALAAFQAGQAISAAGVGYIHAIAHNVGARYHTPHGLANAIIMPYVLDFSRPVCVKRLARLAEAAGVAKSGDSDELLADKFIQAIRDLNQRFGIPQTLEKLVPADIPGIVQAAMKEASFTYSVPRYMRREDCTAILQKMLPA